MLLDQGMDQVVGSLIAFDGAVDFGLMVAIVAESIEHLGEA